LKDTKKTGIKIDRFFTKDGDDGYSGVKWEKRTASLTGVGGKSIFKQKNIEVPTSWSQTALNIVSQKYFRGQQGTSGRENSARQLIDRVAKTVTGWGVKDNYFNNDDSAINFCAEITSLLIEQKMAFNSPVWFNVGVEAEPQCSACFINSVEDSIEGIMDLAKTEAKLFKYGSGTGTNFSTLRGSKEPLKGGGVSSGPLSFMRGFDAFAGAVKSGGKNRRSAKMLILNDSHPDIEEFVQIKASEEKKAHALIDAGFDGSFDGDAYRTISFQNGNNSVRVSDALIKAVEDDGDWSTKAVVSGEVMDTFKARKLWRQISQAAWECGDPGVQFDSIINDWHTSPNSSRINASNPCCEYVYIDNSACNLASLNLRKFMRSDYTFDTEAFKKAVELTILAQEIIVGNSKYPTEAITKNSIKFRPLGLGYANLGALLMSLGLPYDSQQARSWCGSITALMTGWAYRTSAVIARDVTGAFAGYPENEKPFLNIIDKHTGYLSHIESEYVPEELFTAAGDAWKEAKVIGTEFGYRNGQVTVLAPTGTIGFMMDCDTTGIEPDLALVKYKQLVGGGTIKIVNNTTDEALTTLGYTPDQRKDIVDYINKEDTIEGAPGLSVDHLPVFDCAFRAANGSRSISYMGHIRMMAAAQPFLSGAISKTVNLPNTATVEDVEDAYMAAWKVGLKSLAVYRDGCKKIQPMSTSKTAKKSEAVESVSDVVVGRRKLPDERKAIAHKFTVGGHEGYIHVGLYDTGEPGEIFIRMAKEGSTISGIMDSFATAISLGLQQGVSLQTMVEKFSRSKFEPSGFTGNPKIPRATSIMDYLFRWLEEKFLIQKPVGSVEEPVTKPVATPKTGMYSFLARTDAPMCSECGSITVPNGSCNKCITCGTTTGCS
jgi:ribonucleoside-diphosphate reductase alpha chain